MNTDLLPESWQNALQSHLHSESFTGLRQFVEREREQHQVFPPSEDVFNAFRFTPLPQVRVLILGHDPYHDDGQAHGLSFSVQRGISIPPSLRNIFKELSSDLDVPAPSHGCLEAWARQGVLLLNAVLTVRAHEANSHKRQGWEQFTDRVIEVVNELPSVVFVLWGNPAQQKQRLIASRHPVITAVHPSPLSAHRGFFGSRPFSQINSFLQQISKRRSIGLWMVREML